MKYKYLFDGESYYVVHEKNHCFHTNFEERSMCIYLRDCETAFILFKLDKDVDEERFYKICDFAIDFFFYYPDDNSIKQQSFKDDLLYCMDQEEDDLGDY